MLLRIFLEGPAGHWINFKSFKFLMMKEKRLFGEKNRTKNLRYQLGSPLASTKEIKDVLWREIAKKLRNLKSLCRKRIRDPQSMFLWKTLLKVCLSQKLSSSMLSLRFPALKLDWKTPNLPEKREACFCVELIIGVRYRGVERSKRER